MESKYYKTKSFLALKKEWYKALEESGFDDAEKDEDSLKQNSTANGSRGAAKEGLAPVGEAKEDYYRYADSFQHTRFFKRSKKKERFMWELHCDGLSMRNIAKELKKKHPKVAVNKDIVNEIIKVMRQEMFKKYGVTTKG